jgi:hypothetical protein
MPIFNSSGAVQQATVDTLAAGNAISITGSTTITIESHSIGNLSGGLGTVARHCARTKGRLMQATRRHIFPVLLVFDPKHQPGKFCGPTHTTRRLASWELVTLPNALGSKSD